MHTANLRGTIRELREITIESYEESRIQDHEFPVSIRTYVGAIRLLFSLPPFIPSPFVDVDPEGNICLEWDNNDNSFTVCMKGDEKYFYAGLFGTSEIRDSGDMDDNVELIKNIARVFR